MAATKVGTQEWRERVSRGSKRGKERRRLEAEAARKRAKMHPRDLVQWEEDNRVTEALLPLVGYAKEEAETIIAALGGLETITAQRRALVEDFCRLGIAVRGVMALFLQSNDPDLATRLATLTQSRRMQLQAIGLERLEKQLDLGTHYELEKVSRETEPDATGQDRTSPDDGDDRRGNVSGASVEDTAIPDERP